MIGHKCFVHRDLVGILDHSPAEKGIGLGKHGCGDLGLLEFEQRFSQEDVEKFDEMLKVIADELMPECRI